MLVLLKGNTGELAMLTVKMEASLEAEVKTAAALEGLSKSEFVRRALRERSQKIKSGSKASIYELTKDLCGRATSADPELSTKKVSDLIRKSHVQNHHR